MPSADGHAARAELKQYTHRLTAGVLLQVRSKKSKVHENGRYRKSERVSDLKRAEDGAGRDGALPAFWSMT